MISALILGAALSTQCPAASLAGRVVASPVRIAGRIATAPFRIPRGVRSTPCSPAPSATFTYSTLPAYRPVAAPVYLQSSCSGGVCPAR